MTTTSSKKQGSQSERMVKALQDNGINAVFYGITKGDGNW